MNRDQAEILLLVLVAIAVIACGVKWIMYP